MNILKFFFLLIALASCGRGFPSDGVTFEPCRVDDHCRGTRVCRGLDEDKDVVDCSDDISSCICRYQTVERCESSETCDKGERCFISDSDGGFAACLSCRIPSITGVSFADERPSSCEGIWLGNYTGDICYTGYSTCAADRICQEYLSDGTTDRCSFSENFCYCLPKEGLTSCSSSSTCVDGERCAQGGQFSDSSCVSCGRVDEDEEVSAIDTSAICTTPTPSSSAPESSSDIPSPTPIPTPTDTQSEQSSSPTPRPLISPPPPVSPLCISAHHLLHIPSSRLVFSVHYQASVLCDHFGSCSTPGHIVVFDGISLTMTDYCKFYANCIRKIMLVNSPRFTRGLRVASRTRGLEFTSFSATHETTFEKRIISFLIYLGL